MSYPAILNVKTISEPNISFMKSEFVGSTPHIHRIYLFIWLKSHHPAAIFVYICKRTSILKIEELYCFAWGGHLVDALCAQMFEAVLAHPHLLYMEVPTLGYDVQPFHLKMQSGCHSQAARGADWLMTCQQILYYACTSKFGMNSLHTSSMATAAFPHIITACL